MTFVVVAMQPEEFMDLLDPQGQPVDVSAPR
jgi:hypothetical protein